MEHQSHSMREPRLGIVLISTLLSLMLITGFALTVQAAALANTKALKTLEATHSYDMAKDSLREMMRPAVALSMINPEAAVSIPLNGTAISLEFMGSNFNVKLQDVNGLVNPDLTPRPLIKSLLPNDWASVTNAIGAQPPSVPITIRASRGGATLVQLESIGEWLSVLGSGIPTRGAMANRYKIENSGWSPGLTPEQQVKRALIKVSRVLPD